jgi:hypothetical protein
MLHISGGLDSGKSLQCKTGLMADDKFWYSTICLDFINGLLAPFYHWNSAFDETELARLSEVLNM